MYGGAEFVAVVIANALARCGYDVVLLVSKEIDQRETEQILGEKLDSSSRVVIKPTLLEPRGTFDMYSRTFRSLAFRSRCDILVDVYSNYVFPWTDVCYFHFPYLNRYNYRPKFPYLRSVHLREVLNYPYVLFGKNSFINYDTKLLLANSHFTGMAVEEFYGMDAEVLYPPVPSTFFVRDTTTLGDKSRENLVVTVSRFGQGKGLETIPYIASLTNRNVRFAMIGLVHDRNVLQSVLRNIKRLNLVDRVKVLTNVSREDVKKILKSARVYLHTTVGEHFGISIVEGMAMGCLPIVHNSGGVKEFVPRNLRYDNADVAAQKIESALCTWSPGKAEEMIRMAERFSEEKFSKRFIELFGRYEQRLEPR